MTHYQQLLVVLLAEARDIRQALQQELRDDGRDAVKMPGTMCAFQLIADAGDADGRDKARRVHLLDRRREDEIDTGLAEFREIGGLATRIGGEILSRPELPRIDKQRGNDALAVPARGLDQC